MDGDPGFFPDISVETQWKNCRKIKKFDIKTWNRMPQRWKKQGKMVAQLTADCVCYKPYCVYIFAKISVCYKPYCVYIFAKKKLSKQGCVTVAEVPQRRQKIQSKTKQPKKGCVARRSSEVPQSQGKVIPQEMKKRKEEKKKSYSGRLLTASGVGSKNTGFIGHNKQAALI